LVLGSDVSLYRSQADVLRTPDSVIVDGSVGIGTANPQWNLDVNHLGATIGTYYVRTRHIDGKVALTTAYDTLYLQYAAAGFGVYIGDTGTDHPLNVYGSGYFAGTLSAGAAPSATVGVYSYKSGALGAWSGMASIVYDTATNPADVPRAIRAEVYTTNTSGTVLGIMAVDAYAKASGSGGTTTDVFGVTSLVEIGTGHSVNTAQAFHVYGPIVSGTVQFLYGLRISAIAGGATKNYSIYSAGGEMYHAGAVELASTLLVRSTISGVTSAGTARWALDTSGSDGISILTNGTATPFSNANNFSGMLYVNDYTVSGQAALFITGNGIALVSQTGTVFSATKDTASKINVYLEAGVLIIQNKTAGTVSVRVMAFRIRISS
jgi:hypothetical protein